MNRLFPRRVPKDPREAAVWWATRAGMDPEAHAGDKSFARWHEADPSHAAAWSEIEKPLAVISAHAAAPRLREMRDAALDIVRARAPKRRARPYWLAAAALAAGLFAVSIWFAQPQHEVSALMSQRFATRIGERRDIELPDGSRVTLNTASTLEVSYSSAHRDVRLLGGQALFQVAKDRNRPFIVAAGDRRITATGTAFDVRVDHGGGVRVLLVEGRVNVEPARLEGLSRVIPSLSRDTLDPGQQFSSFAEGTRPAAVEAADIEQATAWKRGRLIFRQNRLDEVIEEINRYSTTQITLADPGLAEIHVSGVFPADRKEDFLAAVQALYPISVEYRGGSLVVLSWQQK